MWCTERPRRTARPARGVPWRPGSDDDTRSWAMGELLARVSRRATRAQVHHVTPVLADRAGGGRGGGVAGQHVPVLRRGPRHAARRAGPRQPGPQRRGGPPGVGPRPGAARGGGVGPGQRHPARAGTVPAVCPVRARCRAGRGGGDVSVPEPDGEHLPGPVTDPGGRAASGAGWAAAADRAADGAERAPGSGTRIRPGPAASRTAARRVVMDGRPPATGRGVRPRGDRRRSGWWPVGSTRGSRARARPTVHLGRTGDRREHGVGRGRGGPARRGRATRRPARVADGLRLVPGQPVGDRGVPVPVTAGLLADRADLMGVSDGGREDRQLDGAQPRYLGRGSAPGVIDRVRRQAAGGRCGTLFRGPGSMVGSLMRISDLGRKSGVPIATIKFYLRERLLPQGKPTGRNQAEYDEGHLRRLRLIRTFTNIGQLDLSTVRDVLAAIDNDRMSLQDLYEIVDRSLFPADPVLSATDGVEAARAEVDGFVGKLGWQVTDDARGRLTLAHVLAALQRLGCDCGVDFFVPYAKAAERLAVQELDLLPDELLDTDRAAAAVRSVLLEVALSALRRMAQEHYLAQRLSGPASRKSN